ncbi:MAG: hypothetical protein PHR06_03965 [Candidatus Cloacimonetes bacterium]|nr:hypothetical protein [Candidatus Cloacimonadota bacterium]
MKSSLILSDDGSKLIINVLLNIDKSFIPQAEYAFRTYFKILRLQPRFFYEFCQEEIHIYYGLKRETESKIQIYCDQSTFNFFKEKKQYEEKNVIMSLFGGEYIPFLFSQQGDIFTHNKNRVKIRKDIVASAFYFLSCWQEFTSKKPITVEQRYDYHESLQYLLNFTDIPVVDRYCQIFRVALSLVFDTRNISTNWKTDKKLALSLSHDVDYWGYGSVCYNKPTMKTEKKKDKSTELNNNSTKRIKCFLRKLKSPFYSAEKEFDSMLNHEKKLSVDSTLFLLAKTSYDDTRRNYLNDESVKKYFLNKVKQKNIAFHGSESSAFDFDILKKELDEIKQVNPNVKGFRTHYLYFEYQKLFSNLEKAGIQYDASIGFRKNYGFRAGTSYPFYPFDIVNNRPFNVLEIPFTIMDTTLNSPALLNLPYFLAKNKITEFFEKMAKSGGHISILWHNNTFDFIDFRLWGQLYWHLIKWAKRNDVWICSLHEMYEIWKES